MKKMQLIAITAFALCATLAANADTWDGTAWSQDFTGLTALPSNLELGTGYDGSDPFDTGSTTVTNNQVEWSLDNYRQMVKTTATNYCDYDFTYEATVTIDGTIAHDTIFMGMGSADMSSSWLPDFPNVGVSIDPCPGCGAAVYIDYPLPIFASGLAAGTYRLRMEFDASEEGAVFGIQTNYSGGAFVAHYSSTNFYPLPGLPAGADACLYFGGGSGCTFDDISATNHIAALIERPVLDPTGDIITAVQKEFMASEDSDDLAGIDGSEAWDIRGISSLTNLIACDYLPNGNLVAISSNNTIAVYDSTFNVVSWQTDNQYVNATDITALSDTKIAFTRSDGYVCVETLIPGMGNDGGDCDSYGDYGGATDQGITHIDTMTDGRVAVSRVDDVIGIIDTTTNLANDAWDASGLYTFDGNITDITVLDSNTVSYLRDDGCICIEELTGTGALDDSVTTYEFGFGSVAQAAMINSSDLMGDGRLVVSRVDGIMGIVDTSTFNGSAAGGDGWDGWKKDYIGVNVEIAVLPTVQPATILSIAPVPGSDLLEIIIGAPAAAENYHPEHSLDLPGNSWTNVPHADATNHTFYTTNLGYSTASDVTNETIYVKGTNSAEFFKIIGK